MNLDSSDRDLKTVLTNVKSWFMSPHDIESSNKGGYLLTFSLVLTMFQMPVVLIGFPGAFFYCAKETKRDVLNFCLHLCFLRNRLFSGQ